MPEQRQQSQHTKTRTGLEGGRRAPGVPECPRHDTGQQHRDAAHEVEQAECRSAQVCRRGVGDHGREQALRHSHTTQRGEVSRRGEREPGPAVPVGEAGYTGLNEAASEGLAEC